MIKNLLVLYTLMCAAHLSAAGRHAALYQREPSVTDQNENPQDFLDPQEYWDETERFFKKLLLQPKERVEFDKAFFLAYVSNSADTGILRRKAKLFDYLNRNLNGKQNVNALKEMIRSAKTNEHLDTFVQSLL